MSVALGTQHAKSISRVISWPAWLIHIFPHYLINKQHDCRGGEAILNIKCVLMLAAILPETFLILRRIERGMIKKVWFSSCRVSVILVSF